MNERYDRNNLSNHRDQNYRDRQADRDRFEYDGPRQPQQWHDETNYGGAPGQDRSMSQMGGSYGGYSGMQAGRDHSRHDAGSRDFAGYRSGGFSDRRDSADDRERGLYPSTHRQGYRGAHGSEAPGQNYASFTGNDYGGRDFAGGNRPVYGAGLSAGARSDYGDWRSYGEERGFLARAGDEIASWFGDENAARRREMDHRGNGPASYKRSDERITEDANDALTRDWIVDASDVTVTVADGEVTLDGFVASRAAKRRAEDCVEDLSGVKHVQNNLRVKDPSVRLATGNKGGGENRSVASKPPGNISAS